MQENSQYRARTVWICLYRMLHHAELLWFRWGSRWGADIHPFMSLEQTFLSFHAYIFRECAEYLSREMATCVTELVQCVANNTCAVLHPGGLAFFSFLLSVDLTKPLKQKADGCSMCEKHTVSVASRFLELCSGHPRTKVLSFICVH